MESTNFRIMRLQYMAVARLEVASSGLRGLPSLCWEYVWQILVKMRQGCFSIVWGHY